MYHFQMDMLRIRFVEIYFHENRHCFFFFFFLLKDFRVK